MVVGRRFADCREHGIEDDPALQKALVKFVSTKGEAFWNAMQDSKPQSAYALAPRAALSVGCFCLACAGVPAQEERAGTRVLFHRLSIRKEESTFIFLT